jgi:hypothetical protein
MAGNRGAQITLGISPNRMPPPFPERPAAVLEQVAFEIPPLQAARSIVSRST